MIVQRLALRCNAVVADNHVYQAAMELGLLTQDKDPGGVDVKRRLVIRPRRKTAVCLVNCAHDGRGGTEVLFHQLRAGGTNAETIHNIAAIVRARAKMNGQLARTIGFGAPGR